MARRNPDRLAEKLLAIRTALELSQRGLIRRMGLEGELTQAEGEHVRERASDPRTAYTQGVREAGWCVDGRPGGRRAGPAEETAGAPGQRGSREEAHKQKLTAGLSVETMIKRFGLSSEPSSSGRG